MERLPDDVLLMMMEYFTATDLVTCRLVSKRWGSLAVHPSVWRHRTITTHCCNHFVCLVLRLAPCVQELRFTFPSRPGVCPLPYATTKCAAETLIVSVSGKGAAQAALAIRHQESLGRLKHVLLQTEELSDSDDVSVVFEVLASMSGLQLLSVVTTPGGVRFMPRAILHSSNPTASLRYFRCTLSAGMEEFCKFVFAGHATTLEKIELSPKNVSSELELDAVDQEYMAMVSLAPLLAGMPNLDHLKCPLLPGLDALASCTSLKELLFVVGTSTSMHTAVLSVTTLLRRLTSQLSELTLLYCSGTRGPTDVGLHLVEALTSGRPVLEALSISNLAFKELEYLPQLETLLTSLPLLPALRHLAVDVVPDELLRAITPNTAPALQSFLVKDRHRCAHSWLHRDTLQSFLLRNPSLHVVVRFQSTKCEDSPCETCLLDCHHLLRSTTLAGFFSHDADKCSSPEDHSSTKSILWIHVSSMEVC
ncbi:uncharacterized protein LOC113205016 isoform X2 [Frankliniella occidentalis]|nr:uncharacterized protein LOC113205016 isoform X2 [Frankliniella occidentalis]